MMPTYLFEIPTQFQAGVYSGAYRQVGALITNRSTGKIVAHLQQTNAARELAMHLVQNGGGVLSSLASPVSLVGTAVTYMQNRAILQGIETLKLLQMGGLAMSGLGIGISLAGFALTQAKLKEVSRGLAAIKDQVSQLAARVEDLFDEAVRDDLRGLEAVCQQVDDGWSLKDPAPSWSAAVEPLYRLEVTFFDRAARSLAEQSPQSIDVAERFLDAALLSSATLVSVRTACREMEAARKAAERTTASLQRLTTGIGLRHVLSRAVVREGTLSAAGRVDALERLRPDASTQVTRLRLREEQAASSGIALQRLSSAGVDGRAYLERMRAEKDAAFALVLPVPELTTG